MNLLSMPRSPDLLWARGGVWRVEAREGALSETFYDLVGQPSSAFPPRAYNPMQEAPNAYLEFAQVRDDLWIGGDKPSFDEICQKLINFIGKYGVPLLPPFEPFLSFTLDRTVEEILQEAARLAVALRCYQALDGRWDELQPAIKVFLESPSGLPFKHSDVESDTREGLTEWLDRTINFHPYALRGIHQTIHFHPDNGWQPGYMYSNLLNALWLQLSQMILRGSEIRRCEACNELFEPNRADQIYHDARCRERANSRKTYRRQREGTNG